MPKTDDEFPVDPIEDNGKAPVSQQLREKLSASAKKRHAAESKTKPQRDASGHFVNTKQSKAVAEVRASIADGVSKAGAVMMPAMPLPGGYCIATASDLADTAARLAERNPRLLGTLSKASDFMDYIALGSWLVGFGVAVQAQTGRMPIDHPLAVNFGVTQVFDDMVASGQMTPAEAARDDGPTVDEGGDRAVAVPDILEATPAAS